MIILIMFLLKMSSSFAFEVDEFWNHENRLQLEFRCSSADRFCHDLCFNDENCKVDEKVCFNCIGTSMLMNSIFDQIDLKYRNTLEEVSSYEIIDFLNKKSFVSLSSKSIFNQIETYDSPVLKSRFQSLCPDSTAYPQVIFELNPISNSPRAPKYIFCNEKIFRMSDSLPILTNAIGNILLK